MGKLDAAALVQELRDVFATGKTKSAEWRIEQLNGMVRLGTERKQEIIEAMKQDLNKPAYEAGNEVGSVGSFFLFPCLCPSLYRN